MSAKTARDHKLIRADRALFVLHAAIWLAIGVVSMVWISDGGQMTIAVAAFAISLSNVM